jgi:FkbH-like protein/FkbM family methyltransferase
METLTLANGLAVCHVNRYETDFVYREIFVERVYSKHGIEIRPGDCVFDVGANIGLFSLFARSQAPDVRIYAFEPAPALFELLQRNLEALAGDARCLPVGLSDRDGQQTFTYYPDYTILSGFAAQAERDRDLIVAGARARTADPAARQVLHALAEGKLAQRVDHVCTLRSLSGIVDEHGIARIDLLKIDAENSELPILAGIRSEHWPLIRQLVVEVHDVASTLEPVLALLRGHGFEVTAEAAASLRHSGIANVYATRRAAGPRDRIAVAATFTANPLADGLAFWGHELGWRVDTEFAPYNQLFQELLHPQSALRSGQRGLNAVLLRFEDWLRDAPGGALDEEAWLIAMLDEFIDALDIHRQAAHRHTVVLACPESPSGPLADRPLLVRSLKARLSAALARRPRVTFIAAEGLHDSYEVDASQVFNPVADAAGHVPYRRAYYDFIATLLARSWHALAAPPSKVIAVDCDNTLWRGVCGEQEPRALRMDGANEALQRLLMRKASEGFLVCLCSKNTEEDVWNVFEHRPDMALARGVLAGARINWEPKARNVRELAAALNVGVDSVVFIDDNEAERAAMREGCPPVLAMAWPPSQARQLEHWWVLDRLSVTDEDRGRGASLRANAERASLQAGAGDYRDFIDKLALEIDFVALDGDTLERAAQLTQRTNQFNFTTRRRDAGELARLAADPAVICRAVRVRDRFGDYGIVGLVIIDGHSAPATLDTLLLSCRVLGRGVEHAMAARFGQLLAQAGTNELKLVFRPTPKNTPALRFFEQLAGDSLGDDAGEQWARIATADLAATRFDPEAMTALPPEGDGGGPPAGEPDADAVRRRERLLQRICTGLSTLRGIAAAVESFRAGRMPAPSAALSLLPMSAHGSHPSMTGDAGMLGRLLGLVAENLQRPASELDPDQPFDDWLDSFHAVDLTVALDEAFGDDIPPMLLFTHRTLREVAGFLEGRCDLSGGERPLAVAGGR